MLYTKTAKYAVLALAEVALCSPEQPVSTKQIAEASSVPYPLLAKIVGQLRRANLVIAARGKHGGILLARSAEDITIKDIVLALDGPEVLNDCPLFLSSCDHDEQCPMHSLWYPARNAVIKFMEKTTLQAVANARREMKEPCAG